jgi:CubicO group peptidase (beta-lactamase class C family)
MPVAAAVRINGVLRDCQTDLSSDSVFPIYSITKTLTAICVLRLVEAGSLRLDVPVYGWLPEIELSRTITLTHLLQHTSGLGDYGPLPEYHQAVRRHPDQPWTRKEFLDAVPPNGMLFAPGGNWAYSNIGYMLVVDIVERVTGQTFAQVLAQFVTQPLALRRTVTLETIEDLMACVPGFGSPRTEGSSIFAVAIIQAGARLASSRRHRPRSRVRSTRFFRDSYSPPQRYIGCSRLYPCPGCDSARW